MHQLAQTLRRVPEPPLARFFAQHRGHARFPLSSSDVEECGLQELLALADDETRHLWEELTLGYADVEGRLPLRAEIAGLYPGLEADDVLVCAGADEAILLALTALLGPDDHAVVTWPGYAPLRDVAKATGAGVSLLRLDSGTGWALDPEALRRLLRPTTRVVIVNFPHNPTGALPDRATFEAVVALTREVGATLLSDEVYRFLERPGTDRLPTAAGAGGVSLGGLSKTLGLAGLRIGWLASRDRALLARAAQLKHSASGCASAPSEILALIALRARDRLLARSRGRLHENLALLEAFFESPFRALRVDTAARRKRGLPALASPPARGGVRRRAGARGGCARRSRLGLRGRREPFPDRLWTRLLDGGARGARSLRG